MKKSCVQALPPGGKCFTFVLEGQSPVGVCVQESVQIAVRTDSSGVHQAIKFDQPCSNCGQWLRTGLPYTALSPLFRTRTDDKLCADVADACRRVVRAP
jgi:hypothetical protein